MLTMDRLTLYELTTRIAGVVEAGMPSTYLVEAELASIRDTGHCYMELVQKDVLGATPIAKVRAVCWRTRWSKVAAAFAKATGTTPQAGMKLLLKATVDFNPTFGLSLNVSDIDPIYSIGDMERKRREIISQLQQQGVFDLQRELRLPLFCQRIAVVTSATAAGWGDFRHQVLDAGYAFSLQLFPAIMQGEGLSRSVIEQLNRINESADNYDCVVIIRGGGATSDLSGFDTLELAENVANFPLPILTGIGHERDQSVLDMVAHRSLKTPTAVADMLVGNLVQIERRIDEAMEGIARGALRDMQTHKAHLKGLSDSITASVRICKTRHEAALDRLWLRTTAACRLRTDRAHHRIEMLETALKAMDPEALLARGYSMTFADGTLLKGASQAKPRNRLVTKLKNGVVTSISTI